ncbi:hypothetical protein HGRIS_007377 [Hohenbuehelia grisea]|uniref:Histone-lysine N-methyltransferase, H3 lysine-79 specific n=1 Tax=Hohenbuehelia grisea TaxID=104357 RepID=A0ABR3J4L7_9AGAR
MLTSAHARPASSDLSFFSTSRSSKPVASTVSTVVVTTRIARRPAPTPIALTAPPDSSPAPAAAPSRKRKSPSTPSLASAALSRDVKRLRATPSGDKPRKRVASSSKSSSKSSSRASSRQNTQAPSPEPIYRSCRSRSTSLFPNPDQASTPINRAWLTDADGAAGSRYASSEAVVKRLMRTYKAYFTNPSDPNDKSFEPHPTDYPVAELEYPNSNATERFVLLAPKDKDHYNPILCLEKTLYTMIECYLTPEQQSLFGSIPNDSLVEAPSPPPSPSPSPPNSYASTSSSSSSRSNASLSSLTSLSSSGSRPHTPSPLKPQVNYLRALQRAIHIRDGPLFVMTLSAINSLLRMLKYPKLPFDPFSSTPRNAFLDTVDSWATNGTGLPQKVLFRIIEENYQRSVGPHVASLKNYEAFSSTVYGELMPSFVHEMIRQVGLKEDSLFLDLGSGVGNVVLQASFETGCRSFGVELMPAPATVAQKQLEQFKIRCRMWGLKLGEVELEQGDMLTSQRVTELLPKADVVLVDNKVFEESLNMALRPKFLDLKEGAIVVSLSPFVPTLNARMTERNVSLVCCLILFCVLTRISATG